MPELPEVETMVRGIRGRFEGARIDDLLAPPCPCRPILMRPALARMRTRAIGKRVAAVERLAKRVLLHLENGDAFVIEPRMTGLMLIDDPPDVEHLRIEWKLRQGGRRHSVWFWDRRGLGTVQLLSPAQREERLGPATLGPDALAMTEEQWRARLRGTSRAIKVALLDQKLVAGIGNLYASEILHRAGIHPATPAARLSSPRIARLHAATLEILHEAIRYEGSTLGDGTYRNALNKSGGYQNMHRVYGKADAPCPTCGTAIRRTVQAQRSTFHCPRCQKA